MDEGEYIVSRRIIREKIMCELERKRERGKEKERERERGKRKKGR